MNRDAAARSERQIFALPVVLQHVQRDLERFDPGWREAEPVASRVTCRATDRYRSRCAVEIERTSAKLSKLPSAVSSPGKQRLHIEVEREQVANRVVDIPRD